MNCGGSVGPATFFFVTDGQKRDYLSRSVREARLKQTWPITAAGSKTNLSCRRRVLATRRQAQRVVYITADWPQSLVERSWQNLSRSTCCCRFFSRSRVSEKLQMEVSVSALEFASSTTYGISSG